MEDFVTIYNSAWVTHDNFRPMTKEQAVALGKKIAPVMDEDLMWFAYHDGKPVGCYLSLPELNEIFRYVGDRLHWWGKLKFLWYKWRRPPRTAFGIAFGIVPEHQGRGIEGAIFNEFGKRILPKKKYDNIIISWIGDFNPKMIRIIENLKAEKYRTLITYRKIFDPDIPFERCPVIE
jgi:GNAT superfamily N-acetyltransferase